MDKSALRQAIVEQLEAELRVLVSAAHDSKSQATDTESKPDGKYDMAGQSAAYLAAGQAKLATELAEAIAAYRLLPLGPPTPGAAAGLGDLVTLEAQGRTTVYFLGPARGGLEIDVDGASVTVITAVSPLGRQLFGRRPGATVTLPGPGQGQLHAIAKIE
jgi:transcription elongation GreA/GreB family factor